MLKHKQNFNSYTNPKHNKWLNSKDPAFNLIIN